MTPAPHPGDHPGPFALVADVDAPALDPADEHHLARVVRLRDGEGITIGDGAGRWRTATWRAGALADLGPVVTTPPPEPEIAVGFALVKGDKPELVVQKLTEIGVDRIVPFRAARSVVRWDAAKAAKAHGRLQAVARAAAAQCHRPWLPVVEEVAELADLLARPGAVVADRAPGARPLAAEDRLVLVGPEGGWDPSEVPEHVPRALLGPHVLRAETAALTAGALVAARRVGLVGDGAP